MTHFEFFIALIALRSLTPRFVKRQSLLKVYFPQWYNTDKAWKGSLSILINKVIQTAILWLGSGYLLPYFNHYVPLP